ncbi:TIGR03943 family putative permease subunit [Streptomyces sp. NPDC018031]|uniref:TIGR03943 family putative permease subunit n=1 Tax=Streptomyces sp. NPDC018031 TaxID=3365033 RepID=UPI00378F3A69
MKRQLQILLLDMAGAAVLRISLFSDDYLRYVKEGLRFPLILTGFLLIALGMVGAWRDGFPFPHRREPEPAGPGSPDGGGPHRSPATAPADVPGPETGHRHEPGDGDGHGHGHDHSGGPRVAWLLFLPVIGLMFAAPPALASYTAERQPTVTVEERARFDPLPPGTPVGLTLVDFSTRAVWDTDRSLEGRTVRLTGFVTPGEDRGTWYLTRLLVGCCAADAQAVKVKMYGGATPPRSGTWLSVTGTWHPLGAPGKESAAAALDVRGFREIPEPANPYRDTPG